ncbi:MAG: NAD-binding protein [Nannocystaceae bacterium]
MPVDAPAGLRFTWRGISARALIFVGVYLAGLSGLLLGAGVSERALADTDLGARAYYALGLFVMGGMDLGTPTGGPAIARALLWFAYFAAPTITASALLEALWRLAAPFAFRLRRLNDHTIVVGASRLSQLYLRHLRRIDRRAPVIIVEKNATHPRLEEFRARYGALVLIGDITSEATLALLRLPLARRILLLTGDDLVNLDAATRILEQVPELAKRVVLHLGNLGLLRTISGTRASREGVVFNAHETAASHLVREHLLARFHSTEERDLVVLAGFGRFGQTVLHHLQLGARGCFGEVVILDTAATMRALSFAEQVGFDDDYDRQVIDGDLQDPGLWARLDREHALPGRRPLIVVGSGDDSVNLAAALTLQRRYPDAYVIARSFHHSPFAAELTLDAGVHCFAVADLIDFGIPDEWCVG